MNDKELIKVTRYQAIVGWGRLTGSYEYYIADQIRKAMADNAPSDVKYKKDGVWVN